MARVNRQRPEDRPPVGEQWRLRIESLVFGGAGLARADDGRVVFVAFAAPGELVDATIERVHGDYLEAVATRIVEPSSDRVSPACPLFGQCGGCQLQHLAYPAQLRAKEEMVREQLRRIGKLDECVVRPIVGARAPFGYRNHVRFSTGRRFGDVGYVSRRGYGLLKVEHCPIADDFVNELLPLLQGKGSGLHQVQVRHNPQTGDFLIAPHIDALDGRSGQKSYIEALGGRRFRVSASAFFQVNNEQAEEMVRLVAEALPERGQLLVDAFAGVGTFAALFASRFDRVIAIEESHSAALDANENVSGLANVEIRAGKVEDVLPLLEVRPDAVLLDPPRAGCAQPVLRAIGEFRPKVVAYVSCNPATLARDLRVLHESGYGVEHVTPLDMFPQTGHIECVARLALDEATVA